MLYFYWKKSPQSSAVDSVLRLFSVKEAVSIMLDVWIAEQHHELDKYPTGKKIGMKFEFESLNQDICDFLCLLILLLVSLALYFIRPTLGLSKLQQAISLSWISKGWQGNSYQFEFGVDLDRVST
jgi:hypothetical protein